MDERRNMEHGEVVFIAFAIGYGIEGWVGFTIIK